jgi:hypothetical protein
VNQGSVVWLRVMKNDCGSTAEQSHVMVMVIQRSAYIANLCDASMCEREMSVALPRVPLAWDELANSLMCFVVILSVSIAREREHYHDC